MEGAKILIIEDELVTVESLKDILKDRGYNVVGEAASSDVALGMIDRGKPDLVLMDIRIKGDIDGIELAKIVNDQHRIPVIYLTAFADRKTVERAKMTESYGYMIKPIGEMELVTNIEIALYKHGLNRKIREGESRYRNLFDTIGEAVYIHDNKGTITDFNTSMERLTGYSRHEMKTINIKDIFSDRDVLDGIYKTLEVGGTVKDMPVEIRRKDGRSLRCLVSTYRVVGGTRSSAAVHGIIRDVTGQWEAQKKLEEEREFTNAVIESLPAIFFAVDRDGSFVRWNRKLEELSGLSGTSIRGAGLLDLMSEKNRPLFKLKLEEGFARGEVEVEATLILRGAGGAQRDFLITGRRVEIGGTEYLVGAGVDITDRIAR